MIDFLRSWVEVAIILIVVTAMLILLSKNWRVFIIGLAVQYVGVFWMVLLLWPVELAVVKLVVGWMAAAVFGATQPSLDLTFKNEPLVSGLLLRVLASLLVIVIALSVVSGMEAWIPARYEILLGGAILIGMGLLQMGMTKSIIRSVVGLLTLFSGCEVLYAAVENSILVTGLLVAINLGVALVGAYLIIAPTLEEHPG